MFRLILSFILVGVGACAAENDTKESVAGVRAAIVDGEASDNASVVAIQYKRSGASSARLCTGTVVAPRAVLTAKHCVQESGQSTHDDVTGFLVGSGNATSSMQRIVKVREVITTPGAYLADSSETIKRTLLGRDVAVLILEESLNVPEASVDFENEASGHAKDDKVKAVGFGQTPEGASGSKRTSSVSMKQSDESVMHTQASICVGDSGGPLLNAKGHVIGIASAGSKDCGKGDGIFNRIDIHSVWIKAALVRGGLCENSVNASLTECAVQSQVAMATEQSGCDLSHPSISCAPGAWCAPANPSDTTSQGVCMTECQADSDCQGSAVCLQTQNGQGLCVDKDMDVSLLKTIESQGDNNRTSESTSGAAGEDAAGCSVLASVGLGKTAGASSWMNLLVAIALGCLLSRRRSN